MSADQPDFGPNVFVFEPGQKDAQARIHAVFKEQERAQFGTGRYALLFRPGRHTLDVPVGFFTHVAGLGKTPGDVTIDGPVWTDAAWMGRNATCNFWRIAENLTISPPNGAANTWAVSQAAPLRRVHITADLNLSSGGWSSGGFMADCKIDGIVRAGSQQQWFSRNSTWKEWQGGIWNMVFVGCAPVPEGKWSERPFTSVAKTHVIREKPFLSVNARNEWSVRVPPLNREGASTLSWEAKDLITEEIPLDKFHIAKAGVDTSTTLNKALQDGKNLLFTPGLYPLDDTLRITRPNTLVFGLGLPSLSPTHGKNAMHVEAAEGVILSGITFDAGEREVENLLQIGSPDHPAGNAEKPVTLHDIYCRVGGYGPGKAKFMIKIYGDHVIGDNLWLWRADHGRNVGWKDNTCDTGLLVEGNDVTVYGLFVEHTQAHQTIWNGNGGRVYFYQSEMPYDPPSNDIWRTPASLGYASYKVGVHVKTHQAWGLGVYHVFKAAPVIAENAIEAPNLPAVQLNHMLTYRLQGGKPGSNINHVANGIPGTKTTRDMTTLIALPLPPTP